MVKFEIRLNNEDIRQLKYIMKARRFKTREECLKALMVEQYREIMAK